jgi:hypothetical protein
MGGGTSIVGLGCPGSNEPGDGLTGISLAGASGAELIGDGDPDPTQAVIDHAKTRPKRIRARVRMSI